MSAARRAGEAHQCGASLQCTRIELRPAHRVVDVLHGGRIRVLVARAEIERNRDDAVLGHGFMAHALGGAVAQTPSAAVAFDQRRKRPLPARSEYAREQRLVAMTEVFDVLHVELMGSGVEDCSRHSQAPVSEDRASLIFARRSPERNVPHALCYRMWTRPTQSSYYP